MSENPRFRRDVEAFPVEQDGQQLVGVRDPSGYTASVLVLSRPLLAIVALFDGEHPIADVQAEIMRRHGELVRREQIQEIVDALDAQGFLDSGRFAERRRAVDAAFLANPVRPAAHAGGAYVGDPVELRRTMDGFFAAPAGPGAIAWGDGAHGTAVRGVIAPHIDFHRGGPAYAWA